MSHALDALTFPLHGSRLIEASAGTGKTYTIAALYLRLVLGHGQPGTAYARPLLPADILVMTFTRAATRELSDRIRVRLIEAARYFRGQPPANADDTLLPALLDDYPTPQAREAAAWRLALAAESMDDAAIFTIDAWCQRMLREHAFDSGNPFDETLVADESALLTEAIQDYWRQQLYPLADAALAQVLALWPSVTHLAADVRSLLRETLPPGDAGSLAACLANLTEQRQQRLSQLCQGWTARAQAFEAWLDTELAEHPDHWKANLLKRSTYADLLAALAEWPHHPEHLGFDPSDKACERLTPAGLQAARRKGAPPLDVPDAAQALAALLPQLASLPDPAPRLRLHAAHHVADRLGTLKRQARSFGFADMLQRLDHALAGPHGERLRERIVSQYPVALIDEFQDTSPLQYRLFDALYRTAANATDTALLLIGDPKQSIYGFRGADIHSYLQARRATAGRHYLLDTNYRSTQAMVDVVNHWFQLAEQRAGPGAFHYREGLDNPVPFEPVKAHGRSEHLVTGTGAWPALTLQHDLTLRSAGDRLAHDGERCAERIVGWLNDPGAGFQHPQRGFTRLRPADIAILVRNLREASAVRRALARRGVASVYLSDRDSVFTTPEAADLLHWLRAVAAPHDAGRIRAALATATVNLSLPELAHLATDDAAFESWATQFRLLHDTWRKLGILTMLRRTLHTLQLPARWLAQPDGERRLTNFLHVGELLQHAAATLDGEAALVRWLASQIQQPAQDSDDQIVRLESDADLVKVVTIHKSKGLEYPVVCLPYACSFRKIDRRGRNFLSLPGEQGRRQLTFDLNDDALEQADRERLREDLRLFYVALTRARHAVWLGFPAIKSGNAKAAQNHLAAAGYLLAGSTPGTEDDWLTLLTQLADALGHRCRLEPASDTVTGTRLQARDAPVPLHDAPAYQAGFDRHWTIGSFSLLTRDLHALPVGAAAPSVQPDPDPADVAVPPLHARRLAEDEDDRPDDASPPTLPGWPSAVADDTAPWHHFPRGARMGDFLHDQLEWLASEDFALRADGGLQAQLRRRCERAGHGAHADALVHWFTTLFDTPLPALGVALPALTRRFAEMEFWLPAAGLDASRIDTLCQQHLLDRQPRATLAARRLNGMLMGFAVLVFEHAGRYWVLDYKSNVLGTGPDAYDTPALARAMASHRYDVQAVIYLLALHRLLQHRLGPAYQPDQHLGGALYLFVRGIDGPCQGQYVIPADSALLAVLAALDRDLAGATASTSAS